MHIELICCVYTIDTLRIYRAYTPMYFSPLELIFFPALYALMNVAVYRARRRCARPWLAVAKFNTMSLCQMGNLYVAVGYVEPFFNSLGESYSWLGAYATECTLAVIGMADILSCALIHCAFKRGEREAPGQLSKV